LIERDFNLLLNPSAFFRIRSEPEGFAVPGMGNRGVVGFVGTGGDFGGVPETVSAVAAPVFPPGFARILGEFLEEVLSADKTEADNTGADIGCNNQFNGIIFQADAIVPPGICDFFHLDAFLPKRFEETTKNEKQYYTNANLFHLPGILKKLAFHKISGQEIH
jgi:hypothetical protein